MRIASLIIGLVLLIVVGLQSCTVMVGGGLANRKELAGSGTVGVLVAFLFLLGAAFALKMPRTAAVMFALAGLFGWIGGVAGFGDLKVWGSAAFILAGMAAWGSREDRKELVR